VKIPQRIIDANVTDPETRLFLSEFDEPEGSRILEVGSHDSPIASMLSASGFNVIGVDLRECDQRPNYEHVKGDFCNLKEPIRQRFLGAFDAVVSVSAIEHFGLSAVAEVPSYKALYDVIAMRYVYDFLKPGGVCYLTVPFGGRFVELGLHWRTYDWASFNDRLVQDFLIEKFHTAVVEPIAINGRTYKENELVTINQSLFNMCGSPAISCFAKLRKPR
jgi:SAM-dependent methyltransferase